MLAIQLRCEQNTKFRIGAGDLTTTCDILHSDTLFSAIVNSYNTLYGQTGVVAFLTDFEEGKITLSSGFYFARFVTSSAEQVLYFFPKPAADFRSYATDKGDDIKNRKKIRRIRYLSAGLLKSALAAGVKLDETGSPYFECDLLAHGRFGEEFCFDRAELKLSDVQVRQLSTRTFRRVTQSPKVVVSRTGSQSEDVYYQADIELYPLILDDLRVQPGFFFLVEYNLGKEAWKRFRAAVRLMADEGVGGKRSNGYGQVSDVHFDDSFELNPGGEKYQFTVSLLSPAPQDDLESLFSYEIISRGGGYIHAGYPTSLTKKSVRMVREGALLKGNMQGRLVDVAPDGAQPAYQYGLNFSIPFGS